MHPKSSVYAIHRDTKTGDLDFLQIRGKAREHLKKNGHYIILPLPAL